MKKRRKKSIIRTFLLLIAIPIYIFINLSWHQIYYYTHSRKSDKRLTPIVVIYNLGEIMTKPKRESDGRYHYTVPGNSIRYDYTKSISYSYRNGEGIKRLHTSFSISDNANETYISYQLSPELKITNIVEFSPDKIHNVTQKLEDQAMVDRYVKQLTGIIPVVSDPMYTKGIEEYKKKNRHGKVAIFPFCEPQYNVKAL